MPRAARDQQAGFVLVAVLWAVLLIVGVSALLVNVLGNQALSSAAFERNAIAEAAADGVIRATAYRLAFEPLTDDHHTPTNGTWRTCQLSDDLNAQISIQDQDGLVDLNRAPLELLTAALRGMPASWSGQLLAKIAARRAGSSPLAVSQVASASAHAFASLDELLADPGASSASAVLQLLTVHSGSDGLDPRAAPPMLLQQLGGGLRDEWVRPSRMRIFALTAIVGERLRGRSVRHAVIELIRQPEHPFAIREWGTISLPQAPEASGPPAPC